MALLRARLSWFVTLWLLSHAVTLAAVPFALCCRVDMTPAVQAADPAGSGAAADDCPLHAHHGTTHGAATAAVTDGSVSVAMSSSSSSPASGDHTSAACTMRGTCTPSDIALESLLGAIGILPERPVTVAAETSSVLVPTAAVLQTHTPRLASPPPRA